MTLADLQSDEELRREEFPVVRNKVFLAHAGVCALPRRVAEAIRRYSERCTEDDQESLLPEAEVQQARESAARLLGAQAGEIAFVGPTSLALSFVAGGLRFKKNDNILIYFDDYPANVYPWTALAGKGVQVRLINIRELGRIRTVDVLGQLDESTRLVALASCHFLGGYRIDLDAIGSALRQRGILFCVDAIQTLGAFPTTVQHIDFLAADAHKWMLGPCAAGLLYVRKGVQDLLRPIAFGWNNVLCPNYIAQERMTFGSGAKRYEAGTHNLLGLVGLRAALELLEGIGIENIARELLRKRSWLVPALQSKGYSVLHADAPPENASGIITFYQAGTDMAALHERLNQAHIAASLRSDRSGQQFIRFSPHFYNTDSELRRALEIL